MSVLYRIHTHLPHLIGVFTGHNNISTTYCSQMIGFSQCFYHIQIIFTACSAVRCCPINFIQFFSLLDIMLIGADPRLRSGFSNSSDWREDHLHQIGFAIGGQGRIRTHGAFPHFSFQDCCLKPDSATCP